MLEEQSWIKPEITEENFTVSMSCACACGIAAGAGSGHGVNN